ncbi:MAG: hypothetical protein ACRENG_26740, partial [bacterium]
LKPVSNFTSLEEEAHFWDTHDTTEYALEDMDETLEVVGPLKARVEKRRAERRVALVRTRLQNLDAWGEKNKIFSSSNQLQLRPS